jgi:outer membrane translocation and assembly module TamA
VRRYARLSPNSKLTMRAVAAGSIKGDSLPTFRQQSLGGEASLPAYELHQFDCSAHSFRGYGCDRMALVQLEYQSNFRALSRVARRLGGNFGLLDNIRWVAFIDSGRAWTEEAATGLRARGTSDFVTDAGVGLRFGVLGVYWAVPLSDRANDTNFFVRLGPRL